MLTVGSDDIVNSWLKKVDEKHCSPSLSARSLSVAFQKFPSVVDLVGSWMLNVSEGYIIEELREEMIQNGWHRGGGQELQCTGRVASAWTLLNSWWWNRLFACQISWCWKWKKLKQFSAINFDILTASVAPSHRVKSYLAFHVKISMDLLELTNKKLKNALVKKLSARGNFLFVNDLSEVPNFEIISSGND